MWCRAIFGVAMEACSSDLRRRLLPIAGSGAGRIVSSRLIACVSVLAVPIGCAPWTATVGPKRMLLAVLLLHADETMAEQMLNTAEALTPPG